MILTIGLSSIQRVIFSISACLPTNTSFFNRYGSDFDEQGVEGGYSKAMATAVRTIKTAARDRCFGHLPNSVPSPMKWKWIHNI